MLRDYQQAAIEETFNFCRENKGKDPVIVAPTGSGKSHIIAGIIQQSRERWGKVNFLIVAHKKELIEQNAKKLGLPSVFFSASLKSKKVSNITFATIGSIYKKADLFSHVDVLIVDEAHLIPQRAEKGMYRRLIADLKAFGLKRVIGLTATPYRLGTGLIFGEDRLFHDVSYECDLVKLTDMGFLSRIVGKEAVSHSDTTTLKTRMGEFISSEMESMFLQTVAKQVEEIITYGENRKKWLVFCSGIKHSEMAAKVFNEMGVKARSLTGVNNEEREEILDQFSSGEFKVLCNCDILTTGFDQPDIDLVALLRSTNSTGLYVQMVGRGLRVAEGKEDCLLLDFGENIKRHGRLVNIKTTKSSTSEGQDKKGKTCVHCRCVSDMGAEFCSACGQVFMRKCKSCEYLIPVPLYKTLEKCPSCSEFLITRDLGKTTSDEYSNTGWKDVVDVGYRSHSKQGKPDSLRITYYLADGGTVYHYAAFYHGGYASRKALDWANKSLLSKEEFKKCEVIADFVANANYIFKQPSEVKLVQEGDWTRVVDYRFEGDKPRQIDIFEELGVNI